MYDLNKLYEEEKPEIVNMDNLKCMNISSSNQKISIIDRFKNLFGRQSNDYKSDHQSILNNLVHSSSSQDITNSNKDLIQYQSSDGSFLLTNDFLMICNSYLFHKSCKKEEIKQKLTSILLPILYVEEKDETKLFMYT